MKSDPKVFSDPKRKVSIHQFSEFSFELYHGDELVAEFNTLEEAKRYYQKEFK